MAPMRLLTLLSDGALDPEAPNGKAAAFEMVRAATLSELLQKLPSEEWAAVILSLDSELVSEVIVERIARAPGCGALILTAPGAELGAALLSQRVGALALIQEPFGLDEIARRLELLGDEGPVAHLSDQSGQGADAPPSPRLLGESQAMAALFESIARVAASDATVLITGESGTGKEVVAQTLHEHSARVSGPFVAVNCAAIPEQLLESELFGHEKGAFTGASAARIGRFERASGGTLFLDEIGDMSMVLQAKLLRALESRQVEPLGAIQSRPIDVRVIAATNQDLSSAMSEGGFREDLYFRLAVVELSLPPLRERPEDIRPLALHFAALQARRYGRPIEAITEAALQRLAAYDWPGNVRELRNVLDRAVLLAVGSTLRVGHLRLDSASPRASPRSAREQGMGYPTSFSLAQVEADHISRVMDSVDGQLGLAAEVLGIHRNTLSRKLRAGGPE